VVLLDKQQHTRSLCLAFLDAAEGCEDVSSATRWKLASVKEDMVAESDSGKPRALKHHANADVIENAFIWGTWWACGLARHDNKGMVLRVRSRSHDADVQKEIQNTVPHSSFAQLAPI
jgi:hypothetical protein